MTSDTDIALIETLRQRRQQLAERLDIPVILWSGRSSSRNFPANCFPFRASSHFLYFAGIPLEKAAICLEGGKMTLFIDDPQPESALWHGETPSRAEIATQIGADAAFPMSELESYAAGAATIAVQDTITALQQSRILNRPVSPVKVVHGIDLELAQAIVSLRLSHDRAALNQLRQAADVTIQAHIAGMAVTTSATREADVRAAMEHVILAHNMSCAYTSIVTVHGEVLHNDRYHHPLQLGDLLLVDVGAETSTGWAADVTRTWAVSGQFSYTQRAIYDVVLAAHDACIAKIRPGVEYRDIHLLAALVIAQGLVNLGILRGLPEDLGDLAGYEPERKRSDRFGLNYLRLHRPLRPGMLVTIEPGFYQVPAILTDGDRREKYRDVVNWERLAQFADVRGIRIEDDVLITETGREVLTAELPTQAAEVEALVQGDLSCLEVAYR